MNSKYLRGKIDSMAKTFGIEGCAVVEVSAGMVWHAAGQIEDLPRLAEAASDYWRLYRRLKSNFDSLGDMQGCVLLHATHRITMVACGEDMIILTISKESCPVDWPAWDVRVQQLGQLVLGD
jgi:hypothetical protein